MKAEQSSIYRKVERLLIWIKPHIDRFPKGIGDQVLGQRIINDLCEALKITSLALNTDAGEPRLKLINMVLLEFTDFKTLMNVVLVSANKQAHIFSIKQQAQYLDLMNQISSELAAWRNKNIKGKSD